MGRAAQEEREARQEVAGNGWKQNGFHHRESHDSNAFNKHLPGNCATVEFAKDVPGFVKQPSPRRIAGFIRTRARKPRLGDDTGEARSPSFDGSSELGNDGNRRSRILFVVLLFLYLGSVMRKKRNEMIVRNAMYSFDDEQKKNALV